MRTNRPRRVDFGPCPHCGQYLDVAVPVDSKHSVQDGDHGIGQFCRCTVIAVAGRRKALRLRRPTADEMNQLARHESLSLAMCHVVADDLDAMRIKAQKKG